MSASVAVVILAYADPAQVRRLIGALAGVEVFLHCDAQTPDDVLAAMVEGASDVRLVPRKNTVRASWGVVQGELAGLRAVLEGSATEHIVIISGSCYPLVSMAELTDQLADWRGRSRMELNPLPKPDWSFPIGRPDGGMWRFNRRFLTIGGRTVLVRGLPVPLGRRTIPPELRLHACSQWKIYARAHARKLLEVIEARGDLVRYSALDLHPRGVRSRLDPHLAPAGRVDRRRAPPQPHALHRLAGKPTRAPALAEPRRIPRHRPSPRPTGVAPRGPQGAWRRRGQAVRPQVRPRQWRATGPH